MKMNMNFNDRQKKYLMITGIIAGSAAVLAYPAMLLYKRLTRNRNASEEEETQIKQFAPAYRGQHKPHHRKAESNGHMNQA